MAEPIRLEPIRAMLGYEVNGRPLPPGTPELTQAEQNLVDACVTRWRGR